MISQSATPSRTGSLRRSKIKPSHDRPWISPVVGFHLVLLFFLPILFGCTPRSLSPERSERTGEWLERRFGRVNHQGAEELLRKISSRLAVASQLPELQPRLLSPSSSPVWEVTILNTESPNALSIGSGKIFLTRGLLVALSSEAELAAILSHEMAHELLGHIELKDEERPHISFDLQQELGADAVGLKILSAAGYHPRAALSALALFYRDTERGVASPSIERRVAVLSEQLRSLPTSGAFTENTRAFHRVRRELSLSSGGHSG